MKKINRLIFKMMFFITCYWSVVVVILSIIQLMQLLAPPFSVKVEVDV